MGITVTKSIIFRPVMGSWSQMGSIMTYRPILFLSPVPTLNMLRHRFSQIPCRNIVFAGTKNTPVISAFTSAPFWIGKDTQGIDALMKQLFYELGHSYTGQQDLIRILLSQLLIYTVRNYEDHPVSNLFLSHNSMADSKSVIIDEYFLYEYQTLSLEGLSQRLNLSARQTQRLLMEHYGKSFQQKKAEARMSVAAILLSDQSLSITDIAENLGYSSIEHFSSSFRRFYNTSPREFRKHLS